MLTYLEVTAGEVFATSLNFLTCVSSYCAAFTDSSPGAGILMVETWIQVETAEFPSTDFVLIHSRR